MADFWWRQVMPARLKLAAGAAPGAVRGRYEPHHLHPYARALRALSEAMLARAPKQYFTPAQTREPAAWAVVLEARKARRDAEASPGGSRSGSPGGGGGGAAGGSMGEEEVPAAALELAARLAAGGGGAGAGGS